MSNGSRHVLGLLTGLVATGAIAVGLMYSVDLQVQAVGGCAAGLGVTVIPCQPTGAEPWTAVSLMVAVGLVIALVMGSRLSPLASLLPGLVFGAIGGIRAAAPAWTGDHALVQALPRSLQVGYQTHAGSGLFLMIGVAMVAASLFPSRWRARVAKSGGRHSLDHESPPVTVPVHEYGAPALRYGDPRAEPDRPVWESGRPGSEPERPGWAVPPPGPPPFSAP